MKFSCDSCHAQYMISDEKVGAAGVRVRCKKCGNVIHVKRVEAEAPPPEDATVVMTADKLSKIQDQLNAARGIGPDGAPSPLKVTADEIGQAFDSMFSDKTSEDGAVQPSQPQVAAPPVAPDGDPDRAETRVLTAGDIQRMSNDIAPPAPPPGSFENEMTVAAPYARPASRPDVGVEWFVAIRDEQVGPLTPAGVKERWDKGEVGPDTLVWCLGLPDWKPLSSVDELAHLVAPAPTATVRNGAGAPIQSSPSKAPPAPSSASDSEFKPEDSLAEFKPSAASALASLASMAQEEMDAAERAKAAPKPPEPEPAPAPVLRSSPSRADLFADLPSPDASPAAAAPIAVTAASSFGAPAPMLDPYQAPARRGAEPAFGRPSLGESSSLKLVAISVGVAVVILGLVGTLVWALYFKPQREAEERRIAELAAAADAAKKVPAPVPVAPAPTPPVPAPGAPTGAVAAVKPPVAATPTPPPPAEDRKNHRGGGKHSGHHGEEVAAEASPSAPTPAPTPAPAASGGGNGDDFLGGNAVDKEFAKELDGSGDSSKAAAPAHHAVYIPPPPGQADLPQTLGQSDVMEIIVEHKGNFARCKSDHPGGGGTVVMHWRIKPDGHTTDVKRTGGDLDNPPLAKCIQSQVAKLRFGQYKGPAMAPIDFPFNF